MLSRTPGVTVKVKQLFTKTNLLFLHITLFLFIHFNSFVVIRSQSLKVSKSNQNNHLTPIKQLIIITTLKLSTF